MKRLMITAVLVMFMFLSHEQDTANKIRWWQDARFGMFIHWGVYSAESRGEWIMYQEHIPYAEYRKLAENFHPKATNPAYR